MFRQYVEQVHHAFDDLNGENAVFLYVHNPIYSICADTNSSWIRRINIYALADTINCNGSFAFTNDTIYKLGDYGCFGCIGPWSISEKYIAYSNGVNTGWIKVTYDLMDGGTAAAITFSSNEFLTYCNPNSVDDINGNSDGAKSKVKEILTAFNWETEDVGKIESAGPVEALCQLWCLPGFLNNQWSHVGRKKLRKQ